MKISPSLASANQLCLQDELIRLAKDYPTLHIDIEDGNFVPNITFGLKTIKAIASVTDKPMSVHLMVTNPLDYLDELAKLNCDVIFVHAESTPYLLRVLHQIHRHSIQAGIALNPISNIEDYEYCLSEVDKILYMSSEWDGQSDCFNPVVLKKVKKYANIENWMDGGLQEKMMDELMNARIDHLVMGREVFAQERPDLFLSRYNTEEANR